LPRKPVLMTGVVAGVNGDNVSDCTIRDMNARGAQIELSKPLSVGEEIFLLVTDNRAAHLASVAWANSCRAGLSFRKSHAVGLGLSPPLKFLWRLFLGAKLKEIDRAIANGVPVPLAFSAVGLAEEHLLQLTPHAASDEKFEQLLLLAKHLLKNGTHFASPVVVLGEASAGDSVGLDANNSIKTLVVSHSNCSEPARQHCHRCQSREPDDGGE